MMSIEQPFIRTYVGATLQDTTVTAKESFNFWRSHGAPLHVCWSCVANERRETGFNWKAVGDRGTAHGIAQWHEPRRQDVLAGCGIDVNSAGHKGQLSAMFWELKHVKLWDRLVGAKTVAEACDVLVRLYERPAQIERDVKLQIGFAEELRAAHVDWETETVPQLVASVPFPAPAPAELPASARGLVSSPSIIVKAKGAFPTHLTKVGAFPVVQRPCPHYSTAADLRAPRAAILHTTEGNKKASLRQNTLAAFGVFSQHFAPQFLIGVDDASKPTIWQLVPVGVIGAALRAHNDKALVQVEVVAFSDERPWLPDPGLVEVVASLMTTCEREYGIPIQRAWQDGDYGRYGPNSHRSSNKFGRVPGWYGHGDVNVEDVHWDPGNLRWSDVFARARALEAPVA